MKKITRDTLLGEVLLNTDMGKILSKHGVPCVGCPLASQESDKITLGQICDTYGIKEASLIKDLEEIRNKNDIKY